MKLLKIICLLLIMGIALVVSTDSLAQSDVNANSQSVLNELFGEPYREQQQSSAEGKSSTPLPSQPSVSSSFHEGGHNETPHVREVQFAPTVEILQTYTNCDAALRKVRQNKPLSDLEVQACRDDHNSLYETLSRKHGIRENYRFPEPDRTLFYMRAIKTAIVDWEGNGGWVTRATLRHFVLPQLRTFVAETGDPFTAFCAIFPALNKGDVAYAVECFEILEERDTFLARLVLEWSFFAHRKHPMWLQTYYTNKGQQDNVSKLDKLYFPDGMHKVHLADLPSPPASGVTFVGESSTMRQLGIRGDRVICAVDGYRVDTMLQYCYVRDLDPNNPQMDLILWDGTNYKNITVEIENRRFGISMKDYEP